MSVRLTHLAEKCCSNYYLSDMSTSLPAPAVSGYPPSSSGSSESSDILDLKDDESWEDAEPEEEEETFISLLEYVYIEVLFQFEIFREFFLSHKVHNP